MNEPWIPEPEDLETLRKDIEAALASDQRLILWHEEQSDE